ADHSAGRHDDLDRAMRSALERNPGAPLRSIGPNGYFVPTPESIPVEGHPLVSGRSMLDLVIPADRLALVEAWDRVGREGVSEAVAHLSNAPERPVVVELFDVRATQGVFVGL